MKICIVSDSHDNRYLLAAAVKDAKARGAEAVLHCGDVVAPTTLRILNPFELPVHVIHGNNTGDLYSMAQGDTLCISGDSLVHTVTWVKPADVDTVIGFTGGQTYKFRCYTARGK